MGVVVQELYHFPARWFGDKKSVPMMIKGDRDWVERYSPIKVSLELFGGYATWRPPSVPTDYMSGEALGVWGKRNISRFRRILHESGVQTSKS